MRIDQALESLQGQGSQQNRVILPPATSPPRRVQAIGQAEPGEDYAKVAQATPDDAIQLDLSPEGREAAREAALDELRRRLLGEKTNGDGYGSEAATHAEEQRLEDLRSKDREARAREQAVRAAAGALSAGRANYSYQVGPDGRLYVVESEVEFDTSEVPGDPEATLRKAEQLQQAALAAGQASPAERAVAAMAAMMASRAKQQLAKQEKPEE